MPVDLYRVRSLARDIDAAIARPTLDERAALTLTVRQLSDELEAARAELMALRPVVVAALTYHAAFCADPFSPRALDARDRLFWTLANPPD